MKEPFLEHGNKPGKKQTQTFHDNAPFQKCTVKTPLFTKKIYLFESNYSVQSDCNYLEWKQIVLCNNKFILKQTDILCCFNVTLVQIDISISCKVTFFYSVAFGIAWLFLAYSWSSAFLIKLMFTKIEVVYFRLTFRRRGETLALFKDNYML